MATAAIEALEAKKNRAMQQVVFGDSRINELYDEIDAQSILVSDAYGIIREMALAIEVLERELAE